MANSYGNPLLLDTVWTNTTIPAALKPPTGPSDTTNTRNSPIHAQRIIWHGFTGAGSVVIQDINGNVIWEYTVTGMEADPVVFDSALRPLRLKMGGWVLATLSSGVLEVLY